MGIPVPEAETEEDLIDWGPDPCVPPFPSFRTYS